MNVCAVCEFFSEGTRLYFMILPKNVEKIFDWH